MDLTQQLANIQAQVQQLQRVQQMIVNPQAVNNLPVAQQSPVAAVVQEPQPKGQEALLLKLYDEFVNTDEGKQLAAGLAKFARFAQSKAAKQEVQ